MKPCKLIYSFQYPEARSVLNSLWKQEPHFLFDNNYLKAQENKEKEFFSLWKQWSSPVVTHNQELKYFYPTNGSSEAIREVIYQLKNRKRRMVIFKNDYEGYKAFALSCKLKFVEIDKDKALKFKFKDDDTLVFSHPASFDGNIWEGYDELMASLSDKKTQVYVDLCYVGTVAREYKINLDYSNIEGTFISLSKVFGVYFQRIGGLVSKNEEAGLFGNQWFKNMFSLHFGMELIKTFSVYELPRKYKEKQEQLCNEISEQLNAKVEPSDVVFLAYSKEIIKDYERGKGSRFCLTPGLDVLSGGPYGEYRTESL